VFNPGSSAEPRDGKGRDTERSPVEHTHTHTHTHTHGEAEGEGKRQKKKAKKQIESEEDGPRKITSLTMLYMFYCTSLNYSD